MKKITLSLILISLLLTAAPVYGQTVTPVNKFDAAREKLQQKLVQREAKVTKTQERISENLRERATREIDRRITSLDRLIAKINAFKKLSSTQKSTMVSQIQTEITNLTALKAKIDADTDNATLKTDIQSIVKGFRIYALFVPKIHILATSEGLDVAADRMSSLAGKLEARIAEAKIKGEDTASLDLLLTDMKAKITDAKTQAQAARDLVTPLTPDGYPGNKTTLQSARAKLVAGRRDLQLARQDAGRIIQGLRKNTVKPTSSVTPTSAVTPTP